MHRHVGEEHPIVCSIDWGSTPIFQITYCDICFSNSVEICHILGRIVSCLTHWGRLSDLPRLSKLPFQRNIIWKRTPLFSITLAHHNIPGEPHLLYVYIYTKVNSSFRESTKLTLARFFKGISLHAYLP